ncbi:MAG: anthranilate synthase component I [Gammaproteobacteria bacterium]|nr:anthranilate synthase component I [Gammaproteobacteria bacterium]
MDFRAESNAEKKELTSHGGVNIQRTTWALPYEGAGSALIDQLDNRRGVLLASSFEYPGRYTRWDMGFVNPPLEVSTQGRAVTIRALNDRGQVLLPAAHAALQGNDHLTELERPDERTVQAMVVQPTGTFPEELRSKQPSVFSVIRALIKFFRVDSDPYLGLYGAFGYELAFQFDPIALRLERDADQRDLVLYLPDELVLVDHRATRAYTCHYDFNFAQRSTTGLARDGESTPYAPSPDASSGGDHSPGEYAASVRVAKEHFRKGELFEVVPGQTFVEPCPAPPSEVFRRLKQRNPAPYGAFINLGQGEYLVAASPEMYVRVEDDRVETCPISGTIARGADAIGDAKNILSLLNSEKETSELTMCTDVDRNDKSRVCEPGSITVIGRRQIEMYSRLIHTVDHVEGRLRDGYDALDAFLAHTWAVTVTGAPKHAAIQFIEDHERSPRRWYGGAIGMVGFDGNMNTGLTLRTVRIANGVAEVRAGATLLFDSDPEAEEAETRLKASALIDAISRPEAPNVTAAHKAASASSDRKILMVDHQDSFVHTLAGYLRETGAEVVTLRSGFDQSVMAEHAPDLVVLSPGPGRPDDFGLSQTIASALDLGYPVFGVCLGLQGIVEYFGGQLDTLGYPMHGKPSNIHTAGSRLFAGIEGPITAARYHSLFADPQSLPECLTVTARTDDNVIMAVEHKSLPIAAVQFHPESILTLEGDVGRKLIHNVVCALK